MMSTFRSTSRTSSLSSQPHGKGRYEYQSSHPWITFGLDLRKAPWQFWLLLGQAKAKCERLREVPLPPWIAKDLLTVYLVKGVFGTTSIEGNTLTEEEVARRLAGDLKLPVSKEYLGQEVDNILAACNQVAESLRKGDALAVTPEWVRHLNGLVLRDLRLEEHVQPGEFRTYPVGVLHYKAPPHKNVQYLVGRLCDWLEELRVALPEETLTSSILGAILCHLYVAWIHPFGDGNGRTARLLELQLLLGSGVPMPAAHILSNHYNETRAEYYRQLHEASRSGGNVFPFLLYALQGFCDGLDAQFARITREQLRLVWADYVEFAFRSSAAGRTNRRRQTLALEISKVDASVPKKRVLMLSPDLLAAYQGAGTRTLSRDLNELVRMGLLRIDRRGYRARFEEVQGLLLNRNNPPQAKP